MAPDARPSPPASPYFVPDRSSAYEGKKGARFFRQLEKIFGPGVPQGHLPDGRPFARFTDFGEPGRIVQHYWLDASDLDQVATDELVAQLREADPAWPTGVSLREADVRAVPGKDDAGRAILDVQVRYRPD